MDLGVGEASLTSCPSGRAGQALWAGSDPAVHTWNFFFPGRTSGLLLRPLDWTRPIRLPWIISFTWRELIINVISAKHLHSNTYVFVWILKSYNLAQVGTQNGPSHRLRVRKRIKENKKIEHWGTCKELFTHEQMGLASLVLSRSAQATGTFEVSNVLTKSRQGLGNGSAIGSDPPGKCLCFYPGQEQLEAYRTGMGPAPVSFWVFSS